MSDLLNKSIETAKEISSNMVPTKTDFQNAKLDKLEKTVIRDPSKDPNAVLTTEWGTPISNNTTWMKAGQRGPSLLEDMTARDKVHHFDHERIPERVVHARGAGFHGVFECTDPLDESICAAPMLTMKGKTTPYFTRFSTVLGNRGSPDTVRDVRGHAVKFYTDEGNWDIVGNDIPVFFHHDAMRFVDLVHAGKPEPHNDIPQAQTAHNNFWDWISLTPESSLMHMYTLSDWGIPRAYHNLNGHGVNTYKVVGKRGKEHLAKFHWHPEAGVHQHVWDEALKLQGQDPDFHRRYMGEVLAAGMYPKWDFYVQLLDPALEDSFYFDPLDATKIWPESLIPKQKVGTMTLHRGNDDFFAESENVAFCTSHIIPGIDFSDDPLLQGRNFSYNDTQTSRLGGQNYNQIPINQPLCPVYNHNRENYHPHVIHRGTVNYYPNRKELVTSMAELCAPTEGKENGGANDVAPLPDQVAYNTSKYIPSAQCGRQSYQHGTYSGGLSRAERAELIKTRSLGPKFANYYEQAQIFYNSMDDVEKGHIQDAIVFELGKCDDSIIHKRMVERFAHINLELAQFTAQQFGVEVPEKEAIEISTEEYPEFSINKNNPGMLFAPRVAIIALPGLDQEEVFAVKDDLANKGAMLLVIGARSGPIDGLEPAFNLESCRSTMFDALYLPLSNEDVYKTALSNGRVKHFVREMTGHLKPIAVTGTASIDFLDAIFRREISEIQLANKTDKGLVQSYGIISYPNAREDPTAVSAALLETLKLHRCWNRPGVASLAF